MNESTQTVATIKETYVIGTAGHVDHGKSTLVRRLTGIDPDRLREEKARELTIDLGFAWLNLADDLTVSIVDVPGHERFIKNMLAGVGGLDAAMLIVAADEGPMPQTLEHLAILDLLGISAGLVAVTKSDLVDEEWLDLVVEEVRESLAGTTMADVAIVPVSAETGDGIDRLLDSLRDVLQNLESGHRRGKPRLPVDRVFSVAGFGTVVTGTLLGSPLKVGQEIEIVPSQLRSRVRGLQSHGQQVDVAMPGSRTAVNLTGVDRELIQRGDVLTSPGWLKPTKLLDAQLRLVAGAPQALEQNDPVDLFLGAAESSAHVTLLDADVIEPGGTGWVQIRLDREIGAVDGDQFIIRQASPSITIGGGTVLNPHPRRHRRFRPDVIADLETRASGSASDRLLQVLSSSPSDVRSITEAAGLDADAALEGLRELAGDGLVVPLGEGGTDSLPPSRFVALASDVEKLGASIAAVLGTYHQQFPLRAGMAREEVRSRLKLGARLFDALVQTLTSQQVVADQGSQLALPDHAVAFSPDQQSLVDRYVAALRENTVAPPAAGTFGIDGELLGAMAALGLVVRMADNVVYSSDTLEEIKTETLRLIDERGELTLAEFRDHFGSSRKYAQAVLEYFDQQRITRRIGDSRVRGSG